MRGRRTHDRTRTAVSVGALVATAALWVAALVVARLDGHAIAALDGAAAVVFSVFGVLIVRQRPENRLGWVFCLAGLLMVLDGASTEYARHALIEHPGSLPGGDLASWIGGAWLPIPTVGLLVGVLPQLFPTGRVVSRRFAVTLWAAIAFIVLGAVGNAFIPQALEGLAPLHNPYAIEAAKPVWTALIALSAPLGLVAFVGGVASLVVRWRRSSGDERQQLKWFLSGAVFLPTVLLHDLAPDVVHALLEISLTAIPVTMGVAVLRHRLYDLDVVISRTVAYALTSAFIVAVYLAAVAVFDAVVSGSGGTAAHAAAAVIAAAGFQPVRSVLQRTVDHVFYGDRGRPYDAVARLGRQLETAFAPDDVLPRIVETVAQALRLPWVAIELSVDGEAVRVAEHGRDEHATAVTFPMAYQGETIGSLLVAPRDRGVAFDSADRRLLADLARQAAVAAHAVQVTTALQQSRSALVGAREEERRRLRRDLHDGLGPTLAGVTLGLHAVQATLPESARDAAAMLAELEAQIEGAVADVRRLVYGLRPPALDEFGLVRALQMHAAHLEADGAGVHVTIDAPTEGVGRLPAAVEVAAYRIATEAMLNVRRHARAERCTVRLERNGALEVEVVDDGCGIADGRPGGVGMAAMRERTAELGGTLHITSNGDGTGTRVWARLPAGDAP
jgi:signal transduction histidine kinase